MDVRLGPKRREDVNVRVVDEAIVVLDRRASLIHQLNESATLIWDLCDGRHAPAEIADQLRIAYELDARTAARDVMKTVRQLEGLGLLERVATRPAARRRP